MVVRASRCRLFARSSGWRRAAYFGIGKLLSEGVGGKQRVLEAAAAKNAWLDN
jgi:hypothetical protein